LLGVFNAERRAGETATIDQYVQWLRSHQHEQLANLILDNAELARSIQDLIANQHDEVMAKLRSLDRVLSEVASHIIDFKPIADAMAVQSRLSDQAIQILHQLNEAEASRFMELKISGGTSFQIWDGKRGVINMGDVRFIEDDLATLCDLGLLMPDFGTGGDRFFTITRAGAAVGG
jgi:hypothetical protein